MNTIIINNKLTQCDSEEEKQKVIQEDFIKSLQNKYNNNLKIIQELERENKDLRQKIIDNS